MIPSTPSQLLVTEDWTKIYQSYRNADFQSYDFETLRRVMITYLQQNYPEDFNDFIDSSEYIALIDLIAYIGQNLSFRIDLNARENFLETASKRDSILQLAQLVSYVPTRNVPAHGFLKVTAVSTTENVYDSSGINLSNITVGWNDATNSNWYQQFITVINASMPGAYIFGNPVDSATIAGVATQKYTINSSNADVPIYSFLKSIGGTSMNFEITSSSFSGESYIYENPPAPGSQFNIIYQNDNQGSGSPSTGFFAQFRQGTLGLSSFTIDAPVPNEIIGVDTPNINNTDVWLWQLDANGNYKTLWKQVPSIVGSNSIYNNLTTSERNYYSVTSRNRDQIDLNFADGTFGNLPKGKFILLYRQSNGLSYSISPTQMSGILIQIPYISKTGQAQTLTLTLGLQYTVSNSAGPETNASIQTNAPQAYYLQNRIITGEDYNIAPVALGGNILKSKAVARITSGVSKYFELSDVSGKYSSTNIFANDGIVYKNTYEENFEFTFTSSNDIWTTIKQKLEPVVSSKPLELFYLDQYTNPDVSYLGLTWIQSNNVGGSSRGYFIDIHSAGQTVGSYSITNLKYLTPGSMIKFVPPAGKYFSASGTIVSTQNLTTKKYLWAQVGQIVGSGSSALSDGTGPIFLGTTIPTGAIPYEIIPAFVDSYSYSFENSIVGLCLTQFNFGLSFDAYTRSWNIITDTNINLNAPFSLANQGDTSNSSLDASWLISFTWTGRSYKVRYRQTEYIFQSVKETGFYVDATSINYDFINNTVVRDQINVLSINPSLAPNSAVNTSIYGSLGADFSWQVDAPIIEADGYQDPSRVSVSFYDRGSSNFIDPNTFAQIIGTGRNFVFFQLQSDGQTYKFVADTSNSSMFNASYATPSAAITAGGLVDGQMYYFYDPAYNVVNTFSTQGALFGTPWTYGTTEASYVAYLGRSNLKFHYTHNSGQDRRIDPSKSNLIDMFLLTTDYDTAYRSWLLSGTGTEPLPPTSQSLEDNYDSILAPLRAISDGIVYQPVKYKVLFGPTADASLQATFKAVISATSTLSANDISSRILTAINDFFALGNWDFGQSFYFSELSTYVMNLLTPDVTNFVIVPTINNFGGLYEIKCQSNEILISGATTQNIQVIDAITATQLNTTNITTNAGI